MAMNQLVTLVSACAVASVLVSMTQARAVDSSEEYPGNDGFVLAISHLENTYTQKCGANLLNVYERTCAFYETELAKFAFAPAYLRYRYNVVRSQSADNVPELADASIIDLCCKRTCSYATIAAFCLPHDADELPMHHVTATAGDKDSQTSNQYHSDTETETETDKGVGVGVGVGKGKGATKTGKIVTVKSSN